MVGTRRAKPFSSRLLKLLHITFAPSAICLATNSFIEFLWHVIAVIAIETEVDVSIWLENEKQKQPLQARCDNQKPCVCSLLI